MLALNTRYIFLIDGLGAVITAFFLFAVLRPFETYFGMPKDVLEVLSLIALFLAMYSFACFLFYDKISPKYLLPIIIANTSYSLLTAVMVFFNFNRLTFLGFSYFVVEIVIICGIVYFELEAFKRSRC